MNIWTGLLFLEGAIADAPLARELAGDNAIGTRDANAREPESRSLSQPAPGRTEPLY